jgi:ariadne-1
MYAPVIPTSPEDQSDAPIGGTGREDLSDAAKRDLDRFVYYCERFHTQEEAQAFAEKHLEQAEVRTVSLLKSSDNFKWSDVEYLQTAYEELVQCRRVLKYTYVFAYYLEDSPISRNSNIYQRERLEYHQEMLERYAEILSDASEEPLAEMNRTSVVNQTGAMDRFMKNVLKYVEDGMEDAWTGS